ncbi:MAG: MBL fold metallo-hydrolase [Patescibacteria group bacterium]
MTIHYIGLSCFLIENQAGYRILIDPFNDAPEWILGPNFPKEFKGAPFGANIVLMSEPDADHAYAPGDWLLNAPKTKPNSDPFPDLNLRGTVVYEWNGDTNIAWSYTVDGVHLVHLADNAHVLEPKQLEEIGKPDILFMSPSKPDLAGKEDVTTMKNIDLLKPSAVIWAHHLAPKNLPDTGNGDVLRGYFRNYFRENASTNAGYKGESSFMELCYILENATRLNRTYNGVVLKVPTLEITPEFLAQSAKPTSYLFASMLASSRIE